MGGQVWLLFVVWFCWLAGHGGWVYGFWGVLCTHGCRFRDVAETGWNLWNLLHPMAIISNPPAFDTGALTKKKRRLVKEIVVEQLYLGDWIRQSHRLQLTFRRRCERRWEERSAFCIWIEGWVLLRPSGQLALLRRIIWFDPDFGRSTFLAACLRVMPALEEMD